MESDVQGIMQSASPTPHIGADSNCYCHPHEMGWYGPSLRKELASDITLHYAGVGVDCDVLSPSIDIRWD